MAHELNAAALAALVVLAGCTGVDPSHSAEEGQTSAGTTQPAVAGSSAPPAASGPDIRVPLLPSGGPHMQVAATGVLEVDGTCLYLLAPDGTRTFPVFATADTRWNRAAGSLEVGDRTFRPGQTVTLGGSPASALPTNVQWLQAPDARCSATRVFIASSIDAAEMGP
jgi:hypothetical protein